VSDAVDDSLGALLQEVGTAGQEAIGRLDEDEDEEHRGGGVEEGDHGRRHP
jgi:hypothetical protein